MRKRLSPTALAIQRKVLDTLAEYALLPEGARPLVALSGGVDSMVLLSMLHRLERWPLAIAHCNFHLRGEASDQDARFVRAYADSIGIGSTHFIDFTTQQYAAERKCSIELAARELRYAWFEDLRQQYGYSHIVTAHHANDQSETMLLHLSRGAGLHGAAGIPPSNGAIVRPLLRITRAEILQWAQELRVPWREDSSNSTPIYARNRIRLEVMPILEQLHPGAASHMAQTALRLRSVERILDHEARLRFGAYPSAREVQSQGYAVSIGTIGGGEHQGLLLHWLRGFLTSLAFTPRQIEDLARAIRRQRGGVRLYTESLECQLRQGTLSFQARGAH